MRIRIRHQTTYHYDVPPSGVIQILRLTPRNHEGQYVVDWRIDITADSRLSCHEDAFGNIVHTFTADGPVSEISIQVEGGVETRGEVLRQRAELRKRYGCAAVESVPAGLGRRAKGGERRTIMSRVEGSVRLNHAQQCTQGLADASSLGREIVFDAAADPDARDILVDHETQPLRAHPDSCSQAE